MSFYRLVLAFLVVALSLCHVFLARTGFLAPRTRKVIKMEYFETCDQNVYPVMVSGFSFTRKGTRTIINGEVTHTIDIASPIKIEFRIEKCRDKSNPDTCEYYNTWKWDDVCLSFKLPFMGLVVNAFTPPYSCPMKKGHYYLKNASYETNIAEAFFPRSQSITLWKIRLSETKGTSTVACFDVGIRFVATRMGF